MAGALLSFSFALKKEKEQFTLWHACKAHFLILDASHYIKVSKSATVSQG